jgi:hypothetical protein
MDVETFGLLCLALTGLAGGFFIGYEIGCDVTKERLSAPEKEQTK